MTWPMSWSAASVARSGVPSLGQNFWFSSNSVPQTGQDFLALITNEDGPVDDPEPVRLYSCRLARPYSQRNTLVASAVYTPNNTSSATALTQWPLHPEPFHTP